MSKFNTYIFPFLLVVILQSIFALWAFSYDAELSAQYAARWSARAGFPIFLCSFIASSYYRLSKNDISKFLLRNRRQWGLAFAFSHAIHFGFILYFFQVTSLDITIANLGAGLIPYMFIALMAITSNDMSMRLLGRNWKRLHWVGAYSIWIAYFTSYFGRIFEDGLLLIGAIGTILCLVAWGMRLMVRYKIKP